MTTKALQRLRNLGVEARSIPIELSAWKACPDGNPEVGETEGFFFEKAIKIHRIEREREREREREKRENGMGGQRSSLKAAGKDLLPREKTRPSILRF